MIQIIQTPGDINAAFGINAVTLMGIQEPGIRYKLEIRNASGLTLYASLVITPNQYGNGIVDIKNVLQTLVKPSLINTEKTGQILNTVYETKEYLLRAFIVDLLDEPVDEEIAESSVLLTTGGRKDAWEVTYNVPTSALTDYKFKKKGRALNPNPGIPNVIDVKVVQLTRQDYYTLTYKNTFSEYYIYPYINDVEQTTITVPNTLPNEYPNIFITLPVGFKNIPYVLPMGTEYYFVKINNEWWKFEIIEECRYEPIQLSWMNSYGYRDYYTFTKKTDKSTNVARNSYQRSTIDYNFVALQTTRGESGDTIYSQSIDKQYTIRTDFIDEKLSEYFENLIISPSVRAKINNEWFDITPLTNNWTLQRFSSDQLFQFEYSFKISTNINSQRA
jgi:hypothetical protein